ncbi:hypothetical protein [Paraburkholderia dilworthii]|uniref:Uncharacterized protein n=1 Tax=Paraburkholderia dilworthii TaxID=948106 RepID=A0ABW9D7H7_9BURK
MAFTLNGVGSYSPHEHDVLAVTERPVETDAQCKKHERDERKALVRRWIEQAHVRHVAGAVTSSNRLWANFHFSDAMHGTTNVSESEFLAALRSALGRNLATRWRGRTGYLAVLADGVASHQTGDDIDLLPGFDPAPPTDDERRNTFWPIVRMRQAIGEAIANGLVLASLGPLMAHDGTAWRLVDDTRLRDAFNRCFELYENNWTKPMGDAHHRHALNLTFKLTFDNSAGLVLPDVLPARNAMLTIAADGRMHAYPMQSTVVDAAYLDHLYVPDIDWSDVDPITREYQPAVNRDAENHVLDDLFEKHLVTGPVKDATIAAAHVRYETRALRAAMTGAAAASAPRRARL